MGLYPDDAVPENMTAKEAYAKIRAFYQANVSKVASKTDDYSRRSAALIHRLPAPDSVSDEEMQRVFQEVLTGLLEWAYHDSDGDYKMAAYATAGASS